MTYGHFVLTFIAGVCIGVVAATSNGNVMVGAIALTLADVAVLHWYMGYCERRENAADHS